LATVGFTRAELTDLLPRRVDPDDAPSVQDEAITRPGQCLHLGPHRLICGDCSDPDVLAEAMRAERFSCLATDPPYGVGYADKNRYLNAISRGNHIQIPIANDHASASDMALFWRRCFSAIRQTGAPGATYFVTGPQVGDLLLLLLLALRDSDFPLRHMLVWAKDSFVLGRSDYHYQHEPIIYGWLDGAAHHSAAPRGSSSLWQIPRPRSAKEHPTMKPVALVRRMIADGLRPGGVVLDPFAGSGTTLVAAAVEGARCAAIEIDPHYCDVIRRRWAAWAIGEGLDPGPDALPAA
jgi:DNA modification methylase